MAKSIIYLLLVLVTIHAQQPSFGTEGFYISPHGISRQRQVHDALDKIASRISISRTTYYNSGVNYAVDNFTLLFAYNDGRQTIEIGGIDEVFVKGGKIEIQFTFNYSKNDGGRATTGWASGTVLSDPFNYTKQLAIGQDSHLIWQLSPRGKSYNDLTIFNRIKIKRMQPYNETDYNSLQDILDNSTVQIIPATVQKQVLDKFNSMMPQTLNTTLNSYVLGPEVIYQFNHPVKGKMQMIITHHLFDFGITPEDGYKVIYLTEIKDWPEPICQGVSVPKNHLSWDFYGGSQNIHLICLYQEVVEFMQKKTWLDAKLDTTWDCNAFQFYAGDLYDLINNLYINVHPRELLEGECKATADHLVIQHGRDTRHNILTLDVSYNCTARTRDNTYKYIDVLNFVADVKFQIEPKADKISLDFSIAEADVVNMSFKPVGNYYVGNVNLALFKANEVLRKLRGTKVFGTGFPSLARELPRTEVTEQYVLFTDGSHTSSPGTQEFDL